MPIALELASLPREEITRGALAKYPQFILTTRPGLDLLAEDIRRVEAEISQAQVELAEARRAESELFGNGLFHAASDRLNRELANRLDELLLRQYLAREFEEYVSEGRVRFGTMVAIEIDSGEQEQLLFAGPIERTYPNYFRKRFEISGVVSYNSPLGKQLLLEQPGIDQTVTYLTGDRIHNARIHAIKIGLTHHALPAPTDTPAPAA